MHAMPWREAVSEVAAGSLGSVQTTGIGINAVPNADSLVCITQAVAVADRVAAGDLSSDIAVNSKDEMGQLLGALRRMQQSLVKTR